MDKELLERAYYALEHAARCVQTNYDPDMGGHDWDDVLEELKQAANIQEETA
jgi:hypothetical protein